MNEYLNPEKFEIISKCERNQGERHEYMLWHWYLTNADLTVENSFNIFYFIFKTTLFYMPVQVLFPSNPPHPTSHPLLSEGDLVHEFIYTGKVK